MLQSKKENAIQNSIKKEEFYLQNTERLNKIVEYVLLCSNIVPISFLILIKVGIFPISPTIPLCFFPLTVLFFVSIHFFNRNKNFIKFVSYYGMFCCSVFCAFLGSNHLIHLFLAFSFTPFLSCLYYNKKLNLTVLIFNYFLAGFSFFLRSFEGYKMDSLQVSPLSYFLTYYIGFTVEYIFIFIISSLVSSKTCRDFENLFRIQNEKDSLILKLNNSINENLEKSAQIKVQNQKLQATQANIIKFIAKVLGSHDLFTGHHVLHTQKYVDIIARQLKKDGFYTEELTEENIYLFSTAAFLHDIGKIHIPEGILNKMGKFTDAEFKLMQCHPEEGVKLLNLFPQIEDGKFNQIAKDMCLYHHEKWDGSGYPKKISGTQIPLCARIMACADVLDALISERLYKKPFSIEEAMKIFEQSKGSHFEPCIADAVIKCKPLIFVIDEEFKNVEKNEQQAELKWWQNYHEELMMHSKDPNFTKL